MSYIEQCCIISLVIGACGYLAGCGLMEYPESYAAPDFEVYRLTTDAFPDWWDCSYEPKATVCEATIIRNIDDDYVLEIGVSSNEIFTWDDASPEIIRLLTDEERASLELTYLPPRTLTDDEVGRMKALFADLHINRRPFRFNIVCCLGGIRLLRVHRWDDVQLGTHTYDGLMIDYRDSFAIVDFVEEFVPPE